MLITGPDHVFLLKSLHFSHQISVGCTTKTPAIYPINLRQTCSSPKGARSSQRLSLLPSFPGTYLPSWRHTVCRQIFPKISTPVLENQLNKGKDIVPCWSWIFNQYFNLQLPPNLVYQTPPASERPWSFEPMPQTCPWYQHPSSASALPQCQQTRPTSGPLVQLPWFHGRFHLQSPSSFSSLHVVCQHFRQTILSTRSWNAYTERGLHDYIFLAINWSAPLELPRLVPSPTRSARTSPVGRTMPAPMPCGGSPQNVPGFLGFFW